MQNTKRKETEIDFFFSTISLHSPIDQYLFFFFLNYFSWYYTKKNLHHGFENIPWVNDEKSQSLAEEEDPDDTEGVADCEFDAPDEPVLFK